MQKIRSVILQYFRQNTAQYKQRTVRFVFPSLILSIALLMGASVINTENQSYLKLVPSQTIIKSGERFSIDIYAYAHVPVNAVDLNIIFSPEAVEINGVDKAQSVLTIWTKEPTIENGTITLSGGTYRRGFVGEHIIATIKATAKFSGETEFAVADVELLAGDGLGTAVKVSKTTSASKTSFYIYDQNSDPSEISVKLRANINPDIDGDGVVTLRDISVFMVAWHNQSALYDFNNDGKMNFIDFSIILAKSFFGR